MKTFSRRTLIFSLVALFFLIASAPNALLGMRAFAVENAAGVKISVVGKSAALTGEVVELKARVVEKAASDREYGFSWSQNGRVIGKKTSVQLIFKKKGEYEITLSAFETVSENKTRIADTTHKIVVSDVPTDVRRDISIKIEGTAEIGIDEITELSAVVEGSGSTGGEIKLLWFTDGKKIAEGKSLKAVFKKAGENKIELRATDDRGNTIAAAAHTIRVYDEGDVKPRENFESVKKTMGAEGGKITLSNGVYLEVPEKALGKTVEVTFSTIGNIPGLGAKCHSTYKIDTPVPIRNAVIFYPREKDMTPDRFCIAIVRLKRKHAEIDGGGEETSAADAGGEEEQYYVHARIAAGDDAKVGETVELRAVIGASEKLKPGLSLAWLCNGEKAGDGNSISKKFEKAGKYYFGLEVYGDVNGERTLLDAAAHTIDVAAEQPAENSTTEEEYDISLIMPEYDIGGDDISELDADGGDGKGGDKNEKPGPAKPPKRPLNRPGKIEVKKEAFRGIVKKIEQGENLIVVEAGRAYKFKNKEVLIPVPYYEQNQSTCWAAAALMLIRAYNPAAYPQALLQPDNYSAFGILYLMGISKEGENSGLSPFRSKMAGILDIFTFSGELTFQDIILRTYSGTTSGGYDLLRRVLIVTMVKSCVYDTRLQFKNMIDDVLSDLDAGKPVFLNLIDHAVVAVGYDTCTINDPDTGNKKIYLNRFYVHDPKNSREECPYSMIARNDIFGHIVNSDQISGRSVSTITINKNVPDEKLLQTIHLTESPTPTAGSDMSPRGRAGVGAGFSNGNRGTAIFFWDHARPGGIALAYEDQLDGLENNEVFEFDRILFKKVPVWNADRVKDAECTVRSEVYAINSNGGIGDQLFGSGEVALTVPKFESASDGNGANASRALYNDFISAEDIKKPLAEKYKKDRKEIVNFLIRTSLFSGGKRIDGFDLKFKYRPLLISTDKNRFAPGEAICARSIICHGSGNAYQYVTEKTGWALIGPDGKRSEIKIDGRYAAISAPEKPGKYLIIAEHTAEAALIQGFRGNIASYVKRATEEIEISAGIKIYPEYARFIPPGASATFKADAAFDDPKWTVENLDPKVEGKISNEGVFKAPDRPGYFNITYSVRLNNETEPVTVTKELCVPLAITPETATIMAGETAGFKCDVAESLPVGIKWSVFEGERFGGVNKGTYTAPKEIGGIYHVIAEIDGIPEAYAMATVEVFHAYILPVGRDILAFENSEYVTRAVGWCPDSEIKWSLTGGGNLMLNPRYPNEAKFTFKQSGKYSISAEITQKKTGKKISLTKNIVVEKYDNKKHDRWLDGSAAYSKGPSESELEYWWQGGHDGNLTKDTYVKKGRDLIKTGPYITWSKDRIRTGNFNDGIEDGPVEIFSCGRNKESYFIRNNRIDGTKLKFGSDAGMSFEEKDRYSNGKKDGESVKYEVAIGYARTEGIYRIVSDSGEYKNDALHGRKIFNNIYKNTPMNVTPYSDGKINGVTVDYSGQTNYVNYVNGKPLWRKAYDGSGRLTYESEYDENQREKFERKYSFDENGDTRSVLFMGPNEVIEKEVYYKNGRPFEEEIYSGGKPGPRKKIGQ